jgi:outer membrane protein TolC
MPRHAVRPTRKTLRVAVAAAALCWCHHAPAEKETRSLITLEQAYDRTLATDQAMRIAWIESAKADLLPLSALTRLGPQISGSLGYDPSSQTSSGSAKSVASSGGTGLIGATPAAGGRTVTTRTDLRRASLSWQQTLLDFTVFPAYRLGKLSSEAAKLEYQRIVRETLFGVAKAYYNVLKEQSIVAVNQITVNLADGQLGQAQVRFDAGAAARTDVLRAKATLEDARKTLIESQAVLELARNTLANILNLGPRETFIVAEPSAAGFHDESFDDALHAALALREDFKVSDIAIRQDIERRNEIKGQYGPRVVADISQNWDAYNGTDRSVKSWSASLALQIPIFTGGQREIDLKTAQHQIDQSRLQHEKIAKSIQEEMKAAWLAVRTLKETIKAVRASLEAAEQNYKDLGTRYVVGDATSLDVQIALRDLNNSRTTLASQTYDYQVALRDLQRAEAAFQTARVSKAAAMLLEAAKKPRR